MNTFDIGIFACIVAIVAGIFVLAYIAMRAVDHWFKLNEQDREYAHESVMQNDAFIMDLHKQKKQAEIGYQYNKQLVQCFCDKQKAMSNELIKKLNDGIWDSIKKMEEL